MSILLQNKPIVFSFSFDRVYQDGQQVPPMSQFVVNGRLPKAVLFRETAMPRAVALITIQQPGNEVGQVV